MRRGEVWWAKQADRKAILSERICSLSTEKIEEINRAIKFALSLD